MSAQARREGVDEESFPASALATFGGSAIAGKHIRRMFDSRFNHLN